ncbi:MAG: FKBP-type peptidyl-prolyl cis-trans isomerase [Acidimicrobiia bacterium]
MTGGREKPEVEVPAGPSPTELQVVDLEEGTGAAAKVGDVITVHYVGAHHSSGGEFDASWGGQPFPVPLGQGRVIKGWDQGLVGMKVGGRRQLVIPPDLAYEDRGTPDGTIKPGETLVFVVDLLAIG